MGAVCQKNENYFKNDFFFLRMTFFSRKYSFHMNNLKGKGKVLFVVSKVKQIQNYSQLEFAFIIFKASVH